MVEISQITDRKTLETWLDAQTPDNVRPFSVSIASRVALRVLPAAWRWVLTDGKSSKSDLTALPVLRNNLIAAVAATMPTAAIRQASSSFSSFSFSSSSYAASSAYAASASSADKKLLWTEIQADCSALIAGDDLKQRPIWTTGDNPFADEWRAITDQLQGGDWQFWVDWYQRMLDGAPQNWQMLEQIAGIGDDYLITKEDWKAAPEVVLGKIAEIQLKHALIATPNAEVMSVNPETGKLRVDTLTKMPPDHLSEAIEKLHNVLGLFDFETGTVNHFLPLQAEWEIIKSATQKYGARPRLLHQACVRVIRRLDTKIASGECAQPDKDADIGDFYRTVQEVSVDLFERDALVKEAVTSKAAQAFPELSDDVVDVLLQAAKEIEDRAEGVLHEEMPETVQGMVDPEASMSARKEAFYVTVSRMLRAWMLTGYRGAKTALNEIESITKTVAGISKNIAVISGAGGVASAPLWLPKAIEVLKSWVM